MTYQELLQQYYAGGGAAPIQDGEYRLGQQMVTLPDGRSARMDAAGNLVVYDPATPGAGSEGGGAMYRTYDVGGGVSAPQWQASSEPGRNVRRSALGLAGMAAAPFIGYGVNQLIGAGVAGAGAGAGAGAATLPAAVAPAAAATGAGTGMSWPLVAAMVGSGVANAYTANRAAQTQARAADQALGLQREMFERQTELAEPWRQAGVNALTRMQSGDVGLTQDSSYAFRLSEGLKALQRTRAAGGQMFSGGSERAAMRYGQDLASTEYGNAWNRLAALAGIGQTATGAQAGFAGQYGANAGNMLTSGAAARASGYVGGANALNQALGQGINLYQQNRLMDLYGPRASMPQQPMLGYAPQQPMPGYAPQQPVYGDPHAPFRYPENT
jgi:hypothetical protein